MPGFSKDNGEPALFEQTHAPASAMPNARRTEGRVK